MRTEKKPWFIPFWENLAHVGPKYDIRVWTAVLPCCWKFKGQSSCCWKTGLCGVDKAMETPAVRGFPNNDDVISWVEETKVFCLWQIATKCHLNPRWCQLFQGGTDIKPSEQVSVSVTTHQMWQSASRRLVVTHSSVTYIHRSHTHKCDVHVYKCHIELGVSMLCSNIGPSGTKVAYIYNRVQNNPWKICST